jgi:hypothetical protein
MDFQSIVMYLSLKGLNAVEIHSDLVAILKGEAKFYRIVACHLRNPSFSSPVIPSPSESPAPILNESDEADLLSFSEQPFTSVRQLAGRAHLHPSTVYDHPAHKLGFTVQDIFVGSYLFCGRLTSTPEHNFHLNSSRCSNTRKTGHSMTW